MLNYEYPPLGGGAANATKYLLREFSGMDDLAIDLVTSSVSSYREEQFSENIRIYFLDIGKDNTSLSYQNIKDLLLYSWEAYCLSWKLRKRKRYDLVHAFFGVPCGYIAMKLDLPYIVSLRGSDVPFYNRRFYWLDKLFFKRLSRKVWSKAENVVALSHDLAQLAARIDPARRITVIRNGIDTVNFYPDRDIRNKENTFNLLFVGRLIERKGVGFLLEAFRDLACRYDNLRLFIAGEGPLMSTYSNYVIRNGLKDKVVFFGRVEHGELNRIYKLASVFILPSLNEALGNVTLEAFASGLPIITTRTGAAELVEENGFIISKASVSDIKKRIVHYLKNPELIELHGARSREIAEFMSWRKTAGRYKEIYEQI